MKAMLFWEVYGPSVILVGTGRELWLMGCEPVCSRPKFKDNEANGSRADLELQTISVSALTEMRVSH